MPRRIAPLSTAAVAKITRPGLHSTGGTFNLFLQINPNGVRSWIVRYSFGGRRRDMGLGPCDRVSLTDARDAAHRALQQVRAGHDPLAERRAVAVDQTVRQVKTITFDAAADRYVAQHEPKWKNPKTGRDIRSSLKTYAGPVIGKLPVDRITKQHVIQIIEPIWYEQTKLASDVRARIEAVLDWCKGRDYLTGTNVAEWKGGIDAVLPEPRKIHKVEHFEAVPWIDIPALMVDLAKIKTSAARCLELTILAGVRSAVSLGALWSEIDLNQKIWTIPAARMKKDRQFIVPLSEPAVALLGELEKIRCSNFVFPGQRQHQSLGKMAMERVMEKLKRSETVHGFRSALADWAHAQVMQDDRPAYPQDMIERALAHKLSPTEAAYRRGDETDQRRPMMAAWADHCVPRDNVVALPIRA